MTLRTAALEAIHGRKGTHLAAQLPVPAMAVAGQEAAPKRVAHAGGIDDLALGNGWNEDLLSIRVQVGAILAASNDKHFYVLERLLEIASCLLQYEAELVVVAEQERGTFHVPGQLRALKPQDLLAGIVQIRDTELTALGRELHHGVGCARRDDHQARFLAQGL